MMLITNPVTLLIVFNAKNISNKNIVPNIISHCLNIASDCKKL